MGASVLLAQTADSIDSDFTNKKYRRVKILSKTILIKGAAGRLQGAMKPHLLLALLLAAQAARAGASNTTLTALQNGPQLLWAQQWGGGRL